MDLSAVSESNFTIIYRGFCNSGSNGDNVLYMINIKVRIKP